jgi:hypothetical protein
LKALNEAIDTIRAQTASGSIQRGSLLDKGVMEPEENHQITSPKKE